MSTKLATKSVTPWLLKPIQWVVDYIGARPTIVCTLALSLLILSGYIWPISVSVWNDIILITITLLTVYLWYGISTLGQAQVETLVQGIHQLDLEHFDPRNLDWHSVLPHDTQVKFIAVLRELARVNQLQQNRMKEVAYSAQQVIETANAVSDNVNKQSDATNSTASAITEMTHSLQEVASKIGEVHKSSVEASDLALSGKTQLKQLESSLSDVTVEATNTQHRMSELKILAESVESSSHMIQNISQQTNLLALNASIEAARAGQFGRGFAVVAEEVRDLAERSHQVAEEIVNVALSVLNQCNNIIDSMTKVVERTEISNKKADNVNSSLEQIVTATQQVQIEMEIVSTNAEQQNIATREISEHVELVVQGAMANANIAQQSEHVATHLKSLTEQTV